MLQRMQSWIFCSSKSNTKEIDPEIENTYSHGTAMGDCAFVWNTLLFWSFLVLFLIRNERKQSCLKMMQMKDLRKPWRVKSIGCVCGRIGEECSDSKGTDRAAAAKGRSPRIQSQHFGIKTLKGRDDKTFEGCISQTAVSTSLERVNQRRRETFQRDAIWTKTFNTRVTFINAG